MSELLKETLALAKELSQSDNEANLRASIGRSYYCIFHYCLIDLGITDTRTWAGGKGGTHQKVIDEYAYGANKNVSYMLEALKKKRHHADYDLTKKINKVDAEVALKSALKILDKIGVKV